MTARSRRTRSTLSSSRAGRESQRAIRGSGGCPRANRPWNRWSPSRSRVADLGASSVPRAPRRGGARRTAEPLPGDLPPAREGPTRGLCARPRSGTMSRPARPRTAFDPRRSDAGWHEEHRVHGGTGPGEEFAHTLGFPRPGGCAAPRRGRAPDRPVAVARRIHGVRARDRAPAAPQAPAAAHRSPAPGAVGRRRSLRGEERRGGERRRRPLSRCSHAARCSPSRLAVAPRPPRAAGRSRLLRPALRRGRRAGRRADRSSFRPRAPERLARRGAPCRRGVRGDPGRDAGPWRDSGASAVDYGHFVGSVPWRQACWSGVSGTELMSFRRSVEAAALGRFGGIGDPPFGDGAICSTKLCADLPPGPMATEAAASGGGEITSRLWNRTYCDRPVLKKLCTQFGAPVKTSAWNVLEVEPLKPQPTAPPVGVSELQTMQLLKRAPPVAVFSSRLFL